MYQPDTTYGATSYYPNQYQAANPTAATSAMAYFPYAPQTTPKHLQPVELSPPDPTEPSVTPDVASIAMQRLVSYELRNAGFERAAQPAVQRLEREVGTCMFGCFVFHGVTDASKSSSSYFNAPMNTQILPTVRVR